MPADTLVVIPAKNEAKTLANLLNQLKTYPYDVVVVNDASDDTTAAIAQNAGVTVINLLYSLGAWGAIQTGLRYAKRRHYSVVLTMDADGQHLIETLAWVRAPVAQGQADVCIGACVQRGSFLRHLAWRLFRRLSGLKVEDLTSGLRAYNQTAVFLLASPAATLLDYQDMGVLLLLRQAGLELLDIPVNMEARHGKSRIFYSWWKVLGYMAHTLLLILAKTDSKHLLNRR